MSLSFFAGRYGYEQNQAAGKSKEIERSAFKGSTKLVCGKEDLGCGGPGNLSRGGGYYRNLLPLFYGER